MTDRRTPIIRCVGGPLDGQEVEVDRGRKTFIVEEQHPILIDSNFTEYVLVAIPQNGQTVAVVEGVVGVLHEPDDFPGALAVLAIAGKLGVCGIVASAFDEEQLQTTVRSYLTQYMFPDRTVRIA